MEKVSTFLDRDSRPNATVITRSEAQVSKLDNFLFSFKGILGAIETRIPNSYVGFTGIEIPISLIQDETSKAKFLNLSLIKSSNRNLVLTYQLVTSNQKLFSLDMRYVNPSEIKLYLL